MRRVSRLVDDRCQHCEFVPTEAGNQIRVTDIQLESFGDSAEKRDTDRMTHRIVDILEMVEIEKEHGKLLVASLGSRDGLLDLLQEYGSVKKPGKSVVTRAVATFGFGILPVGDVRKNHTRPKYCPMSPCNTAVWRSINRPSFVSSSSVPSHADLNRVANTRQKLFRILRLRRPAQPTPACHFRLLRGHLECATSRRTYGLTR